MPFTKGKFNSGFASYRQFVICSVDKTEDHAANCGADDVDPLTAAEQRVIFVAFSNPVRTELSNYVNYFMAICKELTNVFFLCAVVGPYLLLNEK